MTRTENKGLHCASCILSAFIGIFGCASNGDVRSAPLLHTRRELTRGLNQIETETPKSRVLSLLGQPDDIRTRNDPGGISTIGIKEIWCYGTSGHLSTPTIGQVYIGTDDRVQYVCGKGE